ncbi:unnamed protein product [Diabrotica balteata]|uniref:Uncharacterized protein n=1 Tax=Diabrotica balteata TaxID=107213 RepID=A0A9N9SYM1_DIABA|nr:unnamed protein product [Diabrotica balteata]
MNQNLKSCTQHSSDSSSKVYKIAKSRLRSFRSVTSKLYMARKKLQPVVNDILKTASQNSDVKPGQQGKSYYLTIDQYKDAMWAARLLKEVEDVLKLDKNKKPSFQTQSFTFDAKVKVNKGGKIYIDTPILLQLIDLHKLLGDIIDFLQELPQDGNDTSKEDIVDQKSSQSKSLTISTGSSEDSRQSEPEKITKEILTTLTMPLSTDFVVLTANNTNSKIKLSPSQQKPSAIKMNTKNESKPTLSTSSRFTNTNNNNNKEEVVDADGAKKIIVKCMADLDKVRHFLEKDFSVQSVRIEKPKSYSAVNAANGGNFTQNGEPLSDKDEAYKYDMHDGCCCMDSCPGDQPLEFTWKENGETGSKLVICIKGKSEEDGDIHVVIRQCPECLHGVMTDDSEPCDPYIPDEDIQPVEPSVPSFKEPSKVEVVPVPPPPRDPSHISTHEPSKPKIVKSENSHHVNVIFDPDDPRRSIVQGPNIKLNDTVNLHLTTSECNQDLIISLSVKPKGVKSKPVINIDDILTDSQTSVEKSKISVNQSNSKVAEKVIPIFRTKICSSMEIDLDNIKTKLYTTDMQHPSEEVQARLNDIGVHNLLRASRPAKCGRIAVLDEFSNKSIPYAPSLRSLPLDDIDIQFINQSLNMSINKIKHSKIFLGESHIESETDQQLER